MPNSANARPDTSADGGPDGRTDAGPGSTELLLETMATHGVDKAVIVQPIYYLYDNRYVIDSLKKYPGKFAAVGILDRHAPDTPDQLEILVKLIIVRLRLE